VLVAEHAQVSRNERYFRIIRGVGGGLLFIKRPSASKPEKIRT